MPPTSAGAVAVVGPLLHFLEGLQRPHNSILLKRSQQKSTFAGQHTLAESEPPFTIFLSPAKLAAVRHSPAFAEALTLGRVANLLRSMAVASAFAPTDSESALTRTRISTHFLSAAILAEAFQLLERSAKHFRHLDAHKSGIKPLLTNPDVIRLRSGFLSPLRNRAIFHNDEEVSLAGVAALRVDVAEPILISSAGRDMDVYHILSDALVFSYFSKDSADLRSGLVQLADFGRRARKLSDSVCHAIDLLVIEALVELGFTFDDTSDAAS